MPHQNPGYDIESRDPKDNRLLFIEVKGKTTDATTVTVSKTQIFTSFNKPDDFILAIVEIEDDIPKEPRYIRQPFQKEPDFRRDQRKLQPQQTPRPRRAAKIGLEY